MYIGPHLIDPPLILAPMAGVTDRPFRQLCRLSGAGLAVSEMTTSDPRLWHTDKSRLRRDHADETGPISVQIAGYDPAMLAAAAHYNVGQGAQIIDINMGCPAKKVCRVDAGSALLKDETLVERILKAVVNAVEVPVTLKIRTGYSRNQRNGIAIARIAEDCGIAALAVHGRTREDLYTGKAEYDTIAAIKQTVRIPVLANGDISNPEQAQRILEHTRADALMIGRAALGNPWIFREIAHFLATGKRLPSPTDEELQDCVLGHLSALYGFYGPGRGVRVARKHIQWFLRRHPGFEHLWNTVNQIDDAGQQWSALGHWFAAAPFLSAA
jgi:tRNA-dihydrouridine synthase B